jgi:hypothetical protein
METQISGLFKKSKDLEPRAQIHIWLKKMSKKMDGLPLVRT